MTDNLDLQIRRQRLRLTQDDIVDHLKLKRRAAVSEFEHGKFSAMGRLDLQILQNEYEPLLDRIEAQRDAAA